jgi:hypothetical protein
MKGRAMNANTKANAELELRPLDRELTEGELEQIAGGITPSIPIPPPRPSFAYSADNAGATDDWRQ